MKEAKRVVLFGSFDPLHAGHVNLFSQARSLGDELYVVVARDSVITATKGRVSGQSEQVRLAAVRAEDAVDVCQLGDSIPDSYQLLAQLDFDILAVGYDQQPNDTVIREKLAAVGKDQVQLVRLAAFEPEKYKSSLLRNNS